MSTPFRIRFLSVLLPLVLAAATIAAATSTGDSKKVTHGTVKTSRGEATAPEPKSVVVVPGANHHFTGKEDDLRRALLEGIDRLLASRQAR